MTKTIAWDGSATLYSITDDARVRGTVRDAIAAYRRLGAERKRSAVLITDQLVRIGDEPPTKEIDANGLEWLSRQLDAEQDGAG